MSRSKSDSTAARPTTLRGSDDDEAQKTHHPQQKPGEIGGPKGPEPTRYGDWEVDGRCTDF